MGPHIPCFFMHLYRFTVRVADITWCCFGSSGAEYRQMASRLFPLLPENTLDNRSIEIRDYLSEPKSVVENARLSHIPSTEVLENSIDELWTRGRLRSREKEASGIDE